MYYKKYGIMQPLERINMSNVTLLQGDCLAVLKGLPNQSIQCCVTSPPYYGLRDYGTAKWEGGDMNCDHKKGEPKWRSRDRSTIAYAESQGHNLESWGKICGKCGAVCIDDQIGLEETPEIYINKLVAVFSEVKRVLKDDGTLCVVMGDSYNAGRNGGWAGGNNGISRPEIAPRQSGVNVPGLKPKDLIGIPWMLAFALRANGAASPQTMYTIEKIRSALLSDFETWDEIPDKTRTVIENLDREYQEANKGGWWLRSDIIWAKPNPMPESVTDRPTKSHEYIFLLAKSQHYFYDADAIREPYAESSFPRALRGVSENNKWTGGAPGSTAHSISQARPNERKKFENGQAGGGSSFVNPAGRNKRDVWTVTTKPYKGAHFATFPPDLIEPCILAGSRIGDTVLDPFNGSGTTGAVAIKHNRDYIGIELNPAYIKLTEERLKQVQSVLIP